ncbi:MAG: thioredoxin family protein [Armatimonadetes bacterium]|nr:thioredoxin family protein [Armatimonadota bacterium]
MDVESHLVPDKTNIICFWATWCPWSQKAQPKLTKLCTENPEYVGLRVDIDTFESPVARQHGITKVPSYSIYGGKGELLASGEEARARVNELFEQNQSGSGPV